jgi:hypothetical protein
MDYGIMTIARIQVVSQSEAVYMLRRSLGPIREWDAWLDDVVSGAGRSVAGLQLAPVAKLSDGYLEHPVYDMAAVRRFIASVRLALPESGEDMSVKTRPLMIDTSGADWSRRKFDKHGVQITGNARKPRQPRAPRAQRTTTAYYVH